MDIPQLRIGDLERNEAIGFLQTHVEQGRLSNEEFNERMGTALGARTHAELTALFGDLPSPKPGAVAEKLPAVSPPPSPAPVHTPPPSPYGAPYLPPSPAYGSPYPPPSPAYGAHHMPPPYAAPPMYAHPPMQQVIVNAGGGPAVFYHRKYNSFWLHVLLFFFTGGIGNIIYAWSIWDWNRRHGY